MNQEPQRQQHAAAQKQYFEERAHIFKEPVPESIEERTSRIVQAAKVGRDTRILDVGTGMGVLIKHFLAAGAAPENIVGCDLTPAMLAEAEMRYPDVAFWLGDFAELPAQFGQFDAIFFNACFGNMFDPTQTIQKAVTVLSPGGRVVISHPRGNAFVKMLREQSPDVIPHLLPEAMQLQFWADRFGLSQARFEDDDSFYLAILERIA